MNDTDFSNLQDHLLNKIDLSRDLADEEIYTFIDDEIIEAGKSHFISLTSKEFLRRKLFNSIRGYDVLQELLDNPDITEIMINGYDSIFIEKQGCLEKIPLKFSSEKKLEDIIQQIMANANRRINESNPIADARLYDGSRVNIVLKPIAINGPIITIRKFPKKALSIQDLIYYQSISQEASVFLEKLVISGYNIFISGGTGSGKTTFLNVLSGFIPSKERIITIEDSAELQLQNLSNLVRLEARQANTEGKNEISIRDLIRSSLRMRPDRIIVGEVRGAEAFDMLQAMNTGHDGSLSTGHGNSPSDMISRLETMVLMGVDMPLPAIQKQIASAIDIFVHLGRLRDHSRRVLEISELASFSNNQIILNPLFKFHENSVTVSGKINGTLLRTKNTLTHTLKLETAGFSIHSL